MGRKVAIPWHFLFSLAAGILYFFFVLPRWPELMGDTTHSLGTTLRIVTGALLALAALPVVFTLLRTRKPELGTPQLALSIRLWSIVAHVLAGALIIGTAISEIWFSLDAKGQYLFGIYGAAAAIGLLGIFGFYLSFVAELPPPPPKPIKAKKPKQRGLRGKKGAEADADEAADTEEATDTEDADDTETEETGVADAEEPATAEGEEQPEPATEVAPLAESTEGITEDTQDTQEAGGGLRNRRPTGKGTHRMRRRRSRGGVAVDE